MSEPIEQAASKLEAALGSQSIEQRPNSRLAGNVYRHAKPEDLDVDEFAAAFEYPMSQIGKPNNYPVNSTKSMLEMLSAVQYEKHWENKNNFESKTNVQCLRANDYGEEWHSLDDESFMSMLSNLSQHEVQTSEKNFLAFFVQLTPRDKTSFGNSIAISEACVEALFDTFHVHPSFLLNLLGRPDYWAPVTKMSLSGKKNRLSSFEYSCQHPRWNLQVQGAPLSVYMQWDRITRTTLYIVAHKEGDTSVKALQNVVNLGMRPSQPHLHSGQKSRMFLEDPFHLHVMLSMLSFEAAKYHINKFRRFMWVQINAVDDHLAGLIQNNRDELGKLTKELQVISQNADSLIAGAEVAIMSANGIKKAHQQFHKALSNPKEMSCEASDAVAYIVSSIQKQKMWLVNYRSRKDSTMNLVYNLVTQQDAANNINLAVDMRRDSASMSAIATLTMLFLPATFTATLLGSGIFSASMQEEKTSEAPGSDSPIEVSSMWWFWLGLTIPLTAIVMISWRIYHKVTIKGGGLSWKFRLFRK